MCAVPYGIRRILFFCAVFLASLVVKAQEEMEPAIKAELVGAEFFGKWSFDHAVVKERLMGSQQDYVTRTVSSDEFWKRSYLLYTPTEIDFLDGFVAHISHPSWAFHAVTVMNEGKLEFRIFKENTEEDYNKMPDLSEVDSYRTMPPVYDLALNGARMSMQSSYFYANMQDESIEGILTIYYKK